MKLNLDQKQSKISQILEDIHSLGKVSVFGFDLGERVMLANQVDNFVCYITDTRENAEIIQKDLISQGRKTALLCDANDDFTFHLMEFGNANINLMSSLNDIIFGRVNACVITADMLALGLPNRDWFINGAMSIKVGTNYQITDLLRDFVARGYRRVDAVESIGQCAMRGDVLDIFPINCDLPYRLHFFDTEIEKITTFNILTQYSVQEESGVFVCPNAFVLDKTTLDTLKSKLDAEFLSNRPKMARANNPSEFLMYLNNLKLAKDGIDISIPRSMWYYLSAFLPSFKLTDLLSRDTMYVFDQPKQCAEKIADYLERVERGITEGIGTGQLVALHKNIITNMDAIVASFKEKRCLSFQSIITQNKFFSPQKVYSLQSVPLVKLGEDYESFARELTEFLQNGYTIILTALDPTVAQDLYSKLERYVAVEKIATPLDATNDRVNILVDPLYLGACFVEDKLLFLGSHEVKPVRKRDKAWEKQMVKITDRLTLPEVGEYVVHATHGIGVCEGITQLVIGTARRDYIVVSYQNNDKVYVPTEQLDMLGRYIGSNKTPKLSKLGSNAFEKAKSHVRDSVKALAFDLVALYREREKSRGEIMRVDDSTLQEFEASFGYTPTPDQERAFSDVYSDLASGKIMDRLVVGDVGFGKTEVAIRASFVAVMSGFQVAVIVPTTILSEQHYNSFSARLKNYGIEVRCLNRFKTQQEQSQILSDLKSGKVNIIIGTHRLLSDDVVFDNLGLLVLDEEQRFGVGDKEKLKNAKKNVHVLTLTATPIPRTLHLSLVGIRDISTIETPPLDRLPVQTIVSQFSFSLISTAINRELSRNGQVLIVYPRIENIETFAHSLKAAVSEGVRIGIAHGRMQKSRIEDTILALYQGEIDVLVATTLIENGIDLPNANTLIVVEADKFGLSQLYQLRGRVGRSDRLAWAYLTYMDEGRLNSTAYERLSVLMQFTSLGSGFKIAYRDLEIRGAGNILGAEQHGQMEQVGYDMYCKLLDSSIALARGENKIELSPVKIEVDIDAFVPREFELEEAKRMEIYSAIAGIKNDSDATEIRLRIRDQYGSIPRSVEGLIRVATLKAKCQILGATRVSVTRQKTVLYIPKTRTDTLNAVASVADLHYLVISKDNLAIISRDNQNQQIDTIWSEFLAFLDKLLTKLA